MKMKENNFVYLDFSTSPQTLILEFIFLFLKDILLVHVQALIDFYFPCR